MTSDGDSIAARRDSAELNRLAGVELRLVRRPTAEVFQSGLLKNFLTSPK
ncbi:MAG: hypothetical protein ACPLZD_05910 [Candidatus Saccharicenans sp.]